MSSLRWTDVVIRHDGYADPDVEARKLERNITTRKPRPDESTAHSGALDYEGEISGTHSRTDERG
jgi:hypothetical protein